MFYGRNRFNFVFVGAGSSVFTLRLLGDILSEDFIEGGEIRLVDVDRAALDEAEAACRRLIACGEKDFAVSAHESYVPALPGADFVFFTYATGGYQAWKDDIAACTRFGVNQSVGDTIGPGAIIRILRTIPLTLAIVKEMEKVCPEAYVINYANPEGAQCLAIQRHSKIRSFGLCHGTPDTAAALAREVFSVEPERLRYRAAGVNHLTWFTKLTIDGRDVYPELMERLNGCEFGRREQVSKDLLRIFGLYPAPGDRHVQEFFSTFLRDKVIADRKLNWPNNDFRVVDGWREEGRKRLSRLMAGKEGAKHFLEGSGETATHFMRALATGETCCEMVNVPNLGYIDNLSRGITVEVPTFVNELGLSPVGVGSLPEGIAAKCESLGREYLLLVDAAVRRDMRPALQAAYLDPLCAMADDPEGLIKALIRENLSLLPEEWKFAF